MHKVDSSGATVINEFTNGNPGAGVARTRLEAKWMNAVQRELVAPVVASGLALTDTDDQQLLQCLVLHVATITAMRALPVPTVTGTQTVMVMCRNTGSGFGQSYTWSASSTAADDGVNVIRPSSNPASGRWLSLLLAGAGVANNVAWSGVTGKPTTVAGFGITDAITTGNIGSQTVFAVNASVTGTGSINLVYGTMADNDLARILIGGTATNAGFLEIATADDGTEPIYVRQYTGAFTTIARTFTLLDGSGNTSIPGSLTIGGYAAIHDGNIGSQSVSYASTAGRAHPVRSDGASWDLNWSGQSGQPTWLVGGNDGTTFLVYNPSNFSVAYAASAGSAGSATSATNATNATTAVYASSTAAAGTNTTQIASTAFVQQNMPGGAGQTYHSGGRAAGTQYTNGAGHPIFVIVTLGISPSGSGTVYVNGGVISSVLRDDNYATAYFPISFIVPAGATYQVNVTGTTAIQSWVELY